MNRIGWRAAAVAVALGATGCAHDPYRVKLEAMAKGAPPTQSYALKSKDPRLGEESLRYREAAEFVRTALSGKGLYEAPSAERADMVVEVEYGLEKPRTRIESVSVPVYAQVGGAVRYESVPVTDNRGITSHRTVAIYEPPRSELVGYEEMPRPVTIYEKYLKMTARENKPAAEGKPPLELWSIHASAEDQSKDIRKYLPIMASASVEYIGEDTRGETVVRVRADGPGVDFIRRGMPAPAKPAAPADAPPKSRGRFGKCLGRALWRAMGRGAVGRIGGKIARKRAPTGRTDGPFRRAPSGGAAGLRGRFGGEGGAH